MSSLIIHMPHQPLLKNIGAGFLRHFVNAQALRDKGHRLDVAVGKRLRKTRGKPWKLCVLLGINQLFSSVINQLFNHPNGFMVYSTLFSWFSKTGMCLLSGEAAGILSVAIGCCG